MSRSRSYTDEDLARAISLSHSWRGVLRQLGLTATSASAMRSVRRRADELALSYAHFTGHRRWTDDQLVAAVRTSHSWREVVEVLGLADESSQVALRGHAARLGVETSHLRRSPHRHQPHDVETSVDLKNLPRAGSLMAAAWFALCGCEVSWPLEPTRYDLIVQRPDGMRRIQVKTTTSRAGESWQVWLSTTGKQRTTYDPDEIDDFFVIDGDLCFYLIPAHVVGGLHAITLSTYARYCVRAGRRERAERPDVSPGE